MSIEINALYFFLLILLKIVFTISVSVVQCASNEKCTPISKCESLPTFRSTKFKFCTENYTSICCKQPIVITSPPSVEEGRSAKKCLEYHKQIYKDCPSTPYIINGVAAKPKELPHMTLIGTKQKELIEWKCGGSLVSPKFVLTAGHCMEPNINYVRLGELDYSSDNDDAKPQDFYIRNKIIHPNYDFENKTNDVALIELDGEATLNEYVVPICLPSRNDTEFDNFIVSGWGATKFLGKNSNYLQKVQIQPFSEDECNEAAESIDDLGYIKATQICAGSRSDRNDTCQGDSGGPLFVNHPNPKVACMYLIVGVTSYGGVCGSGLPGFYTRLYLFMDWIEEIVWKAKI